MINIFRKTDQSLFPLKKVEIRHPTLSSPFMVQPFYLLWHVCLCHFWLRSLSRSVFFLLKLRASPSDTGKLTCRFDLCEVLPVDPECCGKNSDKDRQNRLTGCLCSSELIERYFSLLAAISQQKPLMKVYQTICVFRSVLNFFLWVTEVNKHCCLSFDHVQKTCATTFLLKQSKSGRRQHQPVLRLFNLQFEMFAEITLWEKTSKANVQLYTNNK